MDVSLPDLERWLWEIAAAIADWDAHPAVVPLLTVRWIGLVSFAPGFASAAVGMKLRLTLAILLSGVMAVGDLPLDDLSLVGWSDWAVALTREFLIGAGLGLAVLLWISAARAAGEWVALVSGVNIQSTYQPDWDGDSGDLPTDIGRLFSLLGMVTFFAARGPLRLLDLVSSSVAMCPLGQGFTLIGPIQAEVAFGLVGEALALSILAAWPILLALITAQVAIALATHTHSVALSWSLLAPTRLAIGLVIMATGLAGMAAGLTGTLEPWMEQTGRTMHFLTHPELHHEDKAMKPPVEGASTEPARVADSGAAKL